MTAIDSLSAPVESFQAGVESATPPQLTGNQAPGVASTSATTSVASSVAPQLAALQSPVATQAAANSSTEAIRMVGKVVEALVSVVQAFMSLMTQLLPKAGSKAGAQVTGSQSATTSGSAATAGGTTAGQTANSASTQPSSMTGSMFDVTKSDAGMVAVRTRDGYMIRAEGKEHAWTITGPDGKTTRIWGDPHVYESDGNKWDFKTRSTFAFGNRFIFIKGNWCIIFLFGFNDFNGSFHRNTQWILAFCQ